MSSSTFAHNFASGENGQIVDAFSTRMVQALVNAMEAKSPYLRGHSHRVAAVAATIAAELGLTDFEVESVRLAGHLHDIGKIGVREAVLDKPGRLTSDEFAHVQEHVPIGLKILSPLTHLGPVLEYIAHHHERVDGSGYPGKLSGNEVSVGGQILGAADALDALTSPRAYREAMPLDEALASLEAMGPRGICPTLVPTVRKVVKNGQVLVFINDN